MAGMRPEEGCTFQLSHGGFKYDFKRDSSLHRDPDNTSDPSVDARLLSP
jgi:hypothetical protein